MPKINQEQAKEWMNNITSKDKIAIILDDDPDGFCSGILFLDFCLKKEAKVETFIYSRGKTPFESYGLEDFNKIILTDIAPGLIDDNLEKIKDKDVLYMDHHPRDAPIPEEVNEYKTLDRGYIPSSRSAYELTGGKRWLSLAGTISDAAQVYKENDEFIEEALKEINMNLEEFKKEVTFTIANFLIYFKKKRNEALDILKDMDEVRDIEKLKKYSSEIKDEIDKYVNNFEKDKEMIGEINFYFIDPKYSVKGSVAYEISTKKENRDRIFIFASPSGKDKISMSARNTSEKRDMGNLLRSGLKDLDGSGGGHKAAGGARLNSEDLPKFKENLRKYLQDNPL